MKPRKKNTFFTFIFSFIPGAAEMYMGFMKSGLSLLVAFIIPILVTGMLYGADYLVLLSGVVYAVSFFHARNIATAPDEEFSNYEDKYVWEEYFDLKASSISFKTYRKWLAIALIFVVACGIWSICRETLFKMFSYFPEQDMIVTRSIVNGVPRAVLSVLVIVFGIVIIKNKKKELIENKDEEADDK